MFTKLLTAAVDVIAPPCAKEDDLHYHWHQVYNDCKKAMESTDPKLHVVEMTHAPKHLQEMLKIIVEEYSNHKEKEVLSPCLEFLLKEKVFDSLTPFALADRPLGIRQYMFVFMSKILNYLHTSHLSQVQINQPLQALVKAAGEKKASPYENQEIEFLSNVCDKIREDSNIILLYIQTSKLLKNNRKDDSSPSEDQSIVCSDCDYPLIEAILNLCYSSNSSISAQAHNCLLTVTALKNERNSEAISSHSLLSLYLSTRLINAAEEIPHDTEPALVEEATSKLDHNEFPNSSSESINSPTPCEFPGRKEICEFLFWLSFCDKIILDSDTYLANHISGVVRDQFLEGFMEKMLLHPNDEAATLFTSLVIKMLSVVSSTVFSNCIISWLLDDREADSDEETVRRTILKRCSSGDRHLQVQSLRLLQTMIEKPSSEAVQCLALQYVSQRLYFDSSAAEHQQNCWSDEEDERFKREEHSPDNVPVSRTLAPSNIQKIVKSFLSIVPEEVRSSSQEDFDSYKADALRHYRDLCRKCSFNSWPREALPTEFCDNSSNASSRESRTESETGFQEGPLLGLLLNFLEELPHQDYDVNLQVTSLVSSLALLPHPHLHEYLLNPTIPLHSGVRTPYSVLCNVVSHLVPSIVQKEDYKNYLKITRFQLLGTSEELNYERDENDSKFEALIVLEEFAKELAAIAYAKFICEGMEKS